MVWVAIGNNAFVADGQGELLGVGIIKNLASLVLAVFAFELYAEIRDKEGELCRETHRV